MLYPSFIHIQLSYYTYLVIILYIFSYHIICTYLVIILYIFSYHIIYIVINLYIHVQNNLYIYQKQGGHRRCLGVCPVCLCPTCFETGCAYAPSAPRLHSAHASTFIYLSIFICLSIYKSIYLSIYLSIYKSIYLHIHISIYLSIYVIN